MEWIFDYFFLYFFWILTNKQFRQHWSTWLVLHCRKVDFRLHLPGSFMYLDFFISIWTLTSFYWQINEYESQFSLCQIGYVLYLYPHHITNIVKNVKQCRLLLIVLLSHVVRDIRDLSTCHCEYAFALCHFVCD